MANTIESMTSKVDFVALLGTYVSFKRALRWALKDSNNAKMEI